MTTITRFPSDPALSQYFASIAHLPFKERLARSRADLPRQEESLSPLKLSREEVQARYSPIPDPNWAPEVEAEFWSRLPERTFGNTAKLSPEKEMLIREFATETLDAKRMSEGYLVTMSAVLAHFADADTKETECLIARRNEDLGSPDTIRTIQAQMLAAGLLVKETRSQGHGFVGQVFVYSPRDGYRYRRATSEYLERSYRATEGEAPGSPVPANISPEDVPY